METESKNLGNLGEKIAKDFLEKRGYKILVKNYIPKWAGFDKKEIDLIAEKDNVLSFVEVKTLAGNKNFSPEDKVDFLKQKKIIRTAESYFLEKKIPFDKAWQIDVIAIRIDLEFKKAKIRHIKNAVGDW
jgi:putative endonuclease